MFWEGGMIGVRMRELYIYTVGRSGEVKSRRGCLGREG